MGTLRRLQFLAISHVTTWFQAYSARVCFALGVIMAEVLGRACRKLASLFPSQAYTIWRAWQICCMYLAIEITTERWKNAKFTSFIIYIVHLLQLQVAPEPSTSWKWLLRFLYPTFLCKKKVRISTPSPKTPWLYWLIVLRWNPALRTPA